MKKQNIIATIVTIAAATVLGLTTVVSITGCSNNNQPTTTQTSKSSKPSKPKVKVETDPTATHKQKEAYESARDYYASSHLSEKGFYQQLEFEGYSDDEIKYALDRLKPDYNRMALKCAKAYYDTRYAMSAQGIYDGLVDDWEGFTPEQAQYAIDHLDVDYNEAALEEAKVYADEGVDTDQIYSQLEYELFTPEQIDYAIAHLND